MKVGITGQSGFIGTHITNVFNLKNDIILIPFENSYFNEPDKLYEFVRNCNIIIHLAAINRHEEAPYIYKTNITLVQKLIDACIITKATPHIIFASSTQEENNNAYGCSKKDGRLLFEKWAKKYKATFTGLIIPNVYGPFSTPYYNSVVATFCYQLSNDIKPVINIDNITKFIFVHELIDYIYKIIKGSIKKQMVKVPYTKTIKISTLLKQLKYFKEYYFDKGIIPDLHNSFERNLFNTFRCFIPEHQFPKKLTTHTDERGTFVEVIKTESGGQFSYSTTKPGITRGNHYHTRKAERFAIIQGEAKIQLRKINTKEIIEYHLKGDDPSFVDMPIWYIHNMTNIGDTELICLFWTSEIFNPEDPDTYFELI